MKNIKAAIVDDELSNINILKTILEHQCAEVEVVWEADNLNDAVAKIKNNNLDVLFLDIEMPPHNSFRLLELLPQIDFEIIFVTAYQEYALQAIKMAALDYLLKPIKAVEVKAAIEKVKASKKGRFNELANVIKEYFSSSNTQQGFSKIVINVLDGYEVIDIGNIICVEGLDGYTKIKLVNNVSHVVSKSLREYEEILSEKGFYRVHKSFLININHVVKIIKGLAPAVIMSDGTNIPISTRKKDEFFTQLKGLINF